MLFLTPYLLAGLAGVAIPVVIHLFNRRHARDLPWGAMRFLLESLARRRRTLLLEELLLLVTRCMLIGCAALAMARPFVPSGSTFPWWLVMPLIFMAITLFGAGFALERHRGWRRGVWLFAILCAATAVGAALLEKRLSTTRFTGGTARDVALVIDGSSSMTIELDGESNFARAVKEAAQLIEEAPRGMAFSLLVAGAVVEPLVPTPVNDRKYLLRALEQATPVHGVMRAPDTLAAAAASLAQGSQATRQIILLGDGQATGWQCDDLESWRSLNAAFALLPERPQIFARILPLPHGIRNLTLKALEFSRPVVGIDRNTRIDVTIANYGREAVTPTHLQLKIGEKELIDRSIGQMEPGTERVVAFSHRFDKPGAQCVTAHIVVDDELVADNSMRRVLQVSGTLKALVVDDGRSTRLLERAGGYIALALQPSVREITATRRERLERAATPERWLIEPELITVGELGAKSSLREYAMVALADLAELPEAQAARVAEFAAHGGALLLTHGTRTQPPFYNEWHYAGQRVTPCLLGDLAIEGAVRIDTATFQHPALALLSAQGDLAEALVECRRQTVANHAASDDDAVVAVAARFQDGGVMLAEHALGKGRVAQFCMPLDRSVGNLVVRQGFLPMVHEVATYLVQPVSARLNLPPSPGAVVQLSSPALSPLAGHGLLGSYCKSDRHQTPLLTRVDPTLDFAWGTHAPARELPADHFSVRWSGSFVPERSGEFTLHLQADDRLSLKIGKYEAQVKQYGETASFSGSFKAGVRYPLDALYGEEGGEAALRVEIEGADLPRQPLPTTWLVPVRGVADSWSDAVDVRIDAPGERRLFGKLRQDENGVALRSDKPLVQGVYQVHVPESAANWLTHLTAGSESGTFPFCVTEDPEESRLEGLSPEEERIIAQQGSVVMARSLEELRQALRGKSFGRELWRIPATLLLLLLILEPLLTRWIFMQRSEERSGQQALE